MAEVYSYVRFSSKGQAHGDSNRRQVESGDKWIKRHGHTLMEAYADRGVSGFRGKNKHKGALGSFLRKVHSGDVKPGSILLVENLDRLSREQVDEAEELFKGIIRAGVKIAVLTPVERVYDKDTLKSPVGLFEPLMAFWVANLESQKKADRLKESWANKRKAGGKYNVKVPSWVDRVNYTKAKATDGTEKKRHDPHAEKFKLNAGAEAVRHIFTRTAEGIGQRRLLAELVEMFAPIGRSGKWNSSFVAKVLRDRSVLGEYIPRVRGEDGKRVKAGPVIPDYWPRVIDEELWHRARAAATKRKRMKGPATRFVNIFGGLLWSAHDGSAVHTQQTRGKQRRLVSYAHLRKLPGTEPLSVPYWRFMSVCLYFLRGLRVEELEPKVNMSAARAKEQELQGVQARIAEIEADMANPDEDYQSVKAALRTARETEKRLLAEAEELRANATSDKPLQHLHEELDDAEEEAKLLNETDAERQARVGAMFERLRLLVHELVRRIEIKPEKHYGRVWCSCLIEFRNGLVRHFAFGPDWVSGSEIGQQFDDVDEWRRPDFNMLGDVAKARQKPGEVVQVKKVPHTIGEAAKLFLQVRRAEMSAASFRVVPSKVERFVSYLGDDLPTKNVNRVRWDRWMTWLDDEVKACRLASGTARISWQRAREFVRWMVEHSACASFGL
jgi:DNA invertase Pin-like site-specific DNA recombinase